MQESIGSIVFPCGAGGNHVRWLLFLDSRFANFFGTNGIESKMHFLEDQVYNDYRTWNNWLDTEGQYRFELDKVMPIIHNLQPNTPNPALYLRVQNLDLALEHYLHINLGLNSLSHDRFREVLSCWDRDLEKFQKSSISIDGIFNQGLSRAFYTKIISHFKFEDNFAEASRVHAFYYKCRRRAANEFYKYFTGTEFNQYLEKMRSKFE